MKSMLCISAITVCLLGVVVDCVLLPQWEMLRRTMVRRAQNEYATRHDPSHSEPKAKTKNRSTQHRRFVPNSNRCCKVGEKTAKKRMSCSSVSIYATARTFNNKNYRYRAKVVVRPRLVKRYAKVLTSKVKKCSLNFAKKFEKCCRLRAEYYRHMKKCKQLQQPDRKTCRTMIKLRYKS